MKRMFGQKKDKLPPPTLEEAAGRMQTKTDTLDGKIRKLDEQLLRCRDQINKSRGPAQEAAKRKALSILKMKRMYEQQQEQLYNQKYNVDSQAFAVQSTQDSILMVQAMQEANKQMKQTYKKNKELKIENIDKLQDEMMDMLDYHTEIQEVLGQSYNAPEIDEDELLGELEGLDATLDAELEMGEGAPAYLQDINMPAAPTGEAAVAQQEDEFGLPPVPARN